MAPPDWSTLPADAISIISTRISDDADYAHFRSVCTSFRSASPIRPHLLPPPHLPAFRTDSPPANPSAAAPSAGSRSSTTPQVSPFTTPSPEHTPASPLSPISSGSTNPTGVSFTDTASFPSATSPLAWLPNSSYPPTTRLQLTPLLAISNFRTRLICCRPGDSCWTMVLPFVCSNERIDDIVSSGDLLLVSSTFTSVTGGHVENGDAKLFFEVFRVDLDFSETISGQLSLFKMLNVGGCSLFVGSSGSMSVSAGTSPWCRGNCIYYICKAAKKKDTVAVYCMEDDSVSSVAGFDSSVDSLAYRDFNWFTPKLCL